MVRVRSKTMPYEEKIKADEIIEEFEKPEPNQLYPGSASKLRREKAKSCK